MKSFVLHIDSLEILEQLTDDQAGKLFKAIARIQNDLEPDCDQMTKILLFPFMQQFKRDKEKYDKIVERNRLNGGYGGRPKKTTKTNPDKPKETQNNPLGYLETQQNPDEPKITNSKSNSKSKSNSESKISNITIFEKEREKLISLAKELYPRKNAAQAFEDMLEYCKVHGKRYADWKLAYFRWVREDTYNKYEVKVQEKERPIKYSNLAQIDIPNFKKNVD